MTYCCALIVDEGIVFASDTRTNAGPDHIAVVPKMSAWECPGERVIVMLVSGNLAITQKVTNLLNERLASTAVRAQSPRAHAIRDRCTSVRKLTRVATSLSQIALITVTTLPVLIACRCRHTRTQPSETPEPSGKRP